MRINGFSKQFPQIALLILSFFGTAVVCSAGQVAGALSQKELLGRCYAQLTGERLPSKDPRWSQLASKKAVDICKQILTETRFDAAGILEQPSNVEQRAVLKQFNDLHRSWFERQFFDSVQFGDGLWGTVDIYEPSQPALFITKALFMDGLPYSSVLSGTSFVKAARDASTASAVGSPTGFLRLSRAYNGGFDGDSSYNVNTHTVVSNITSGGGPGPNGYPTVPVTLVAVGKLIGVTVSQESPMAPFMYTDPNLGPNPATLQVPHNLHANWGGGALGSQGFLLSTFGHSFDYRTNGTTKLPRRWIAAAIKSFLCRPDNYLRDEDVSSYLRTGSEAPPFRQGTSCLKCHATMDQAAITARNLTPAATGFLTPTFTRMTASIARYETNAQPIEGQEFWPWKDVANFRNQTPIGKFYYRTISGDLIDKQVSSLDELGKVIAETDDYYACAAKRYVEYFTGVKVPLFDVGNVVNRDVAQAMSAKDVRYKKFVLDLGKALKETGSVKNLINSVLSSEFYQQPDFGK